MARRGNAARAGTYAIPTAPEALHAAAPPADAVARRAWP
jgi:hypothetical protein